LVKLSLIENDSLLQCNPVYVGIIFFFDLVKSISSEIASINLYTHLLFPQVLECYSDKCTPPSEIPSYCSGCEQKEKEYA